MLLGSGIVLLLLLLLLPLIEEQDWKGSLKGLRRRPADGGHRPDGCRSRRHLGTRARRGAQTDPHPERGPGGACGECLGRRADRIGAAIGVAAGGSVFFARIAVHPQQWADAFRAGQLVTIAFILPALAMGIADVVTGSRRDA